MSNIECPLCTSEDTTLVSTYSADNFSFHLCGKCTGIFADPMKAADKEWYESSRDYLFPSEASEYLKWYERNFLKDYSLYKGKKILNIGCGKNIFLKRLKESGCSVTALDINDRIIDFTKKVLGIEDVHSCEVSDFISGYKGDKFDIIIFFEVLEHLEKPREFILNLKSILKKDGYIFLSVPNRDRLTPSKDIWDSPPHHVTKWNMESMDIFLNFSEYSVIRIFISPLSAEDLLSLFRVYFGTEYLGDKIKQGCKGIHVRFTFHALFKFRVVFYNILAIFTRAFRKNKGLNIYTVARIKAR